MCTFELKMYRNKHKECPTTKDECFNFQLLIVCCNGNQMLSMIMHYRIKGPDNLGH